MRGLVSALLCIVGYAFFVDKPVLPTVAKPSDCDCVDCDCVDCAADDCPCVDCPCIVPVPAAKPVVKPEVKTEVKPEVKPAVKPVAIKIVKPQQQLAAKKVSQPAACASGTCGPVYSSSPVYYSSSPVYYSSGGCANGSCSPSYTAPRRVFRWR